MANTMYRQYLAAEVYSASPLRCVHMLYRGALEALAAARRHLAAGAIRERSNELVRAWTILQELNSTLDHALGGEISRNLSRLYVYMQGRLLEANQRQSDAPMREVESLLNTLEEAWHAAAPQPGAESYDCEPACVY